MKFIFNFNIRTSLFQNAFQNSNLNGGIIVFNNNSITSDTSVTQYIEQQLSIFKRNYLYGLVIVSDSLSISGEFEGGKSQRKIVSDFMIDPSVNFRDYYLHQPEGNSVRYYQMNSPENLNNINLEVFYLDMNNNMKQLNIGQDYTGSIKLHFKKNF